MNQPFQFQIEELLRFVNYLDERIAISRKAGHNPVLLQRKRSTALRQIEQLEQAGDKALPAEIEA